MATLIEMAKDIVAAQASNNPMTTEEVVAALGKVHAALAALDKGEAVAAGETSETPAISLRKAFGKDAVTCLLCGQTMKTLTRHIKTAHGLKPGEYRKQFGIPRTQALAARSYSESRRQMAIDRGLADKLAVARAARRKKKK